MTKIDKVHKVLSEKEIEKCVEEFREWISQHPEFPQDLGCDFGTFDITLNCQYLLSKMCEGFSLYLLSYFSRQ